MLGIKRNCTGNYIKSVDGRFASSVGTCSKPRAVPDLRCKNIRILTDILWRVFRILTEPIPYKFVSINRRNNEARAHIGSVKIRKTRHKISVYIRIFLQCTPQTRLNPPSASGTPPDKTKIGVDHPGVHESRPSQNFSQIFSIQGFGFYGLQSPLFSSVGWGFAQTTLQESLQRSLDSLAGWIFFRDCLEGEGMRKTRKQKG